MNDVTPQRLARAMWIAASSIAFVACQSSPDDLSPTAGWQPAGAARGAPDAGSTPTSTCPDVPTAVLAKSCGQTGCHGASAPASGLDLISPDLAGRLAGWTASQGGLLLDRQAPERSVLYTKLGPTPPFGSRMPVGAAPLDDATRACVLAWIRDGASPAPPTGSDAGATPPPVDASPSPVDSFVPSDLASTVLWLDAASGVTLAGARVSGWADRSTFHNDAAQPSDGNRPTLASQAVNGLPALTFQETRETFVAAADSASLQWGTGGFAIAVVAANRKATVGRGHGGGLSTVFAKPHPTGTAEIAFHLNWFTSETTDDGSRIHVGMGEGEPGQESAADGFNDGKARLYVSRVKTGNGTDLELRVNGTSVGTGHDPATVDVTLAGSPIRVGSTYGQSVEGDVAEVIAMKGAVADADLAKIETYLMTKYGLGAAKAQSVP